MLAYISVNGAGMPASPALAAAKAYPDSYTQVVPGRTLTISDPFKVVIANDVNINGVQLITLATNGTVTLNANGTFSYAPNSTYWTAGSQNLTDTFGIQAGPGISDPPSVCTTSSNSSNAGAITCSTALSTGRVDPPWAGGVEGWQGFAGQNNFIEFGKEPYIAGENGGIKGHVIYASTRPFDDPQMLVQTQWEPLVPHVTINLYKEGTAPDGTTSLTLVDTTQTSSFDDFAQGFRADGTPNMNCPGQTTADLFFFTLFNQPNYLNVYSAAHGGPAAPTLPNNSQFKCYDGMHNWNQLQPAPYDGMYKFPSVTATDANGKPSATNCSICSPDPVAAPDLYHGIPMLPVGKYVVEVVPPAGFEIVKEEDKYILIGDNYIAPVTQEFGGLGNIFILPDQAQIASGYNAYNAQNPTNSLGASPNNGIVPGFEPEPTWPCVGESRIVPDYISLFPVSKQVAPFAGATRNLCVSPPSSRAASPTTSPRNSIRSRQSSVRSLLLQTCLSPSRIGPALKSAASTLTSGAPTTV